MPKSNKKHVKISELNPLTMLDDMYDENFSDVSNFVFYSLLRLTRCSAEKHVFKDELIEFTNKLSSMEWNGCQIPDGAVWDKIFDELERKHCVVTAICAIRMDTRSIDKMHDYYGNITF